VQVSWLNLYIPDFASGLLLDNVYVKLNSRYVTYTYFMIKTPKVSLLPPRIARSLVKLGKDIEIARKKRRLTIAVLCERAGISAPLYARLVAGVPGTSVGAYAMVLFALGMGTPFENLMDAAKDDTGMLLEEERLPKRVRHPRKQSGSL
jgi:hypothetical protein